MFPFDSIRPVQKDFLNDVKNTVENRRHLLAHAPTGLGKTAAALCPAVEYAIENAKTIFFLTPKHSQHQLAVETLRHMKKKSGKKFITTDFIGKKWLCSHTAIDMLTNSDFSDYCKTLLKEERCSFFNNTRTSSHTLKLTASNMLNTFLEKQPLHAEEAKESASMFCAYEILSELAKQSNVIIADYYHVFSPLRQTILTRMHKQLEDMIIITDEAHNLPHRVMDLMSKKISTISLTKASKEAQVFGFYELADEIADISHVLDKLKGEKLKDSYEAFVEKQVFVDMLENKIGSLSDLITNMMFAAGQIIENKKRSHISIAAGFLDTWINTEGNNFCRVLSAGKTLTGKSYAMLTCRCLDPMLITKEVLDQCHSAVLMSGTLYPMEMYRDVLGFEHERTDMHSYPSLFPRENRLNIVVKGVTTRYSVRNENYEKIAGHVVSCANSIPGNVAVFFPSYEMCNRIHGMVNNKIKKQILIEQQGSSKKERRRIYDSFVSLYAQGAVLFGVQAGSFSEGIDLPGKFLNGVIVVGIPLERPNLLSKALIDYYDIKFGRGWDYGYIYPAMIRSIQAAGRCIRSETDRGVCVFLDERFLWGNYRKAFPSDLRINVSEKPEEEIKKFFVNNKEI
ncbi:MAG: ATP-dependent DNA helicase [Candidatus Aenigmatarchaeota archaeon]